MTEADLPAVEAFLAAHADHAMFALSNLATEGLARDGGQNAARSMFVWAWGDPVTAVIAITAEGMILPVLPREAAAHWAEIAPELAGRRAFGITGEAGAARAGFRALGLGQSGVALDRDEPHFALELEALEVPAGHDAFAVVAPGPGQRALMEDWRAVYHVEVLGTRPEHAAAMAKRDIEIALARDTYRMILRDGVPVSMAGINAAAPGIVQVGGVFTPPELRGQGLARHAVAALLADRRARGAKRAVLFAASEAAARAYVAIGFRRIGDYTLTLFDPVVEIAP
ncbi:GNAT family N-acetyltransferase [Pseudooceanicola sp. LIPI14-2-Ac024]|uniref:GNAT family N-acetyltransferase n=1 Tax=Pseudooceanicola sp. LIPI14-2-Ac024 TaxID=3344875 RepID=UPI0035D01AFE